MEFVLTSRKLIQPRDPSPEEVLTAPARERLKDFPLTWMAWLIPRLRALRPFRFPMSKRFPPPPRSTVDTLAELLNDTSEFDVEDYLEDEADHDAQGGAVLDEIARLEAVAAQLDSYRWKGSSYDAALARFIAAAVKAYRLVDDDEKIDNLRLLANAAAAGGVNFDNAMKEIAAARYQVAGRPSPEEVAKGLLVIDVVEPLRLVSIADLISLSARTGAFPHQWGSADRYAAESDATRLYFWLTVDVESALAAIDTTVGAAASGDAPAIVKGALWEIGSWGHSTGHHSESYRAKGKALQHGAEKLFWRLLPALSEKRPPLLALECVYRLFWMAFDEREKELGDDARNLLLLAAKPELGRLRAAFAGLSSEDAERFLDAHIDHIRATSHALFALSTLWDGMKPILLLIRASRIAIFPDDLSWWKGQGVSSAAGSLANALMFYFQAYARFEQNSDPELKDLRSSLAEFCLDRLKRSRDGDGPKEKDPVWRAAFIHAAGELGVNPDGKGHQILFHTMNDDVDAEVRAAAAAVYPRMRQGRWLPDDMSPRRAVLHALWWLRQAHRYGLELDIKEDAAQSTRVEEVRYTTMKSDSKKNH